MHIPVGIFSCIKKTESARAWVSSSRWKSTSSGNAEPYERQKLKARSGGEKGRHLLPRLVKKIAEGKLSDELSWKLKVMVKKTEKKCSFCLCHLYPTPAWNSCFYSFTTSKYFFVAPISRVVLFFLVCSRTRNADTWFASLDSLATFVLSLSHCMLPHNLYL